MFTKMEESLEIRKLPPSSIRELSHILEEAESWKRLMAIIPKTLEKNNFKCNIRVDNLPKYNSEHFRLIDHASNKLKRECAEILFDEWGTSGRVRPTLGHVLHLLTSAELFRAADYVAVNLLNKPPPQRPSEGPAAAITIELPNPSVETEEIERMLDAINYPSSAINSIRQNSQENNQNMSPVIPNIVISESPDLQENPPNFFEQTVVQKRPQSPVSDMIQFSAEQNVPNLSVLLNNSGSIENTVNTCSQSSSQSESEVTSSSIPTEELPAFSQILTEDSQYLPNLSQLNQVNSELTPDVSLLTPDLSRDSTPLTPDLSVFLHNDTSKLSNDSKSRPCNSPLPILSLNTRLPHFPYHNLQIATNQFNNEPFTTQDQSGRLLGSGAFGSVYYAIGLYDKPVAVKKIILDDVQIVNIDDTVTKQFRNEVEVLSKYKHDNLLSLIGYSCDGCTYCLLYEYVPGGALKDRLQNNSSVLNWLERLNIALGTARAVSYLHTAFSTPLIHRDIKSANILLDTSNKPKLCDFGLIKLTSTQDTQTGTTIFGTSAYMAPEAFRGDISVKLDTFSFGVVLLELLTSLPPLDESREGRDLVTHVIDNCEDDITPMLDKSCGSWQVNLVNFAEELFTIASKCLEEKKKRPIMVDVTELLENLVGKLC